MDVGLTKLAAILLWYCNITFIFVVLNFSSVNTEIIANFEIKQFSLINFCDFRKKLHTDNCTGYLM